MTESPNAVRVLRQPDVLACLTSEHVMEAVRAALISSARGEVQAPTPLSFAFREQRGEAHIKGAHIKGSSDWTIKLATGFYGNPDQGLPTASGMSLVSSAETGFVETIIIDGGYLTDVRTAAAGALAADALAGPDLEQVGIVGSGIQARVQLEYLLLRRQPSTVVVFGRSLGNAQRYSEEMAQRLGVRVKATDDAREAVAASQLVITATPSENPIVEASWLEPPVAIVAVGSDMPGKQELEPAVLEAADLVVADDPEQAARVGEIQHASGQLEGVEALGSLLERDSQPTAGIGVADLTGLGAEDAAVAGLVAARARELDLGETFELA